MLPLRYLAPPPARFAALGRCADGISMARSTAARIDAALGGTRRNACMQSIRNLHSSPSHLCPIAPLQLRRPTKATDDVDIATASSSAARFSSSSTAHSPPSDDPSADSNLISPASTAPSTTTMPHTHTIPHLQDLLERNKEWAAKCTTNEADTDVLKRAAEGQHPKILWIGCADSRVPESVVTDTKPGDIFVTRNIGAQFDPKDPNVFSALTYAVEALGVEEIVLVGHTSCGAIATAMAVSGATADISARPQLQGYLTPLVSLAFEVKASSPADISEGELQQRIVEASIRRQVYNVVSTDVVQNNWNGVPSPLTGTVQKKVTVHGWLYNISNGTLHDMKCTQTPPEK